MTDLNREQRIAAAARVHGAADYAAEQAALAEAAVVDVLPSLPARDGAPVAAIVHTWDVDHAPEQTRDYVAACHRAGAGYDRGSRRYYLRASGASEAVRILEAEGFVVAMHPSVRLAAQT